ncbi:MAG: outer membrane protein, partial [Alphaproteobacteria bacterium]
MNSGAAIPNFHIDGTVSPPHASGNFGEPSGQGQGLESFPPPPSSCLEQVNSDFASRRDAYSSTPEKPPVPQKLNLSQKNTSNAPTPAPPLPAPPAPPLPAPPAAAPATTAPAPVIPPAPPLPPAAAPAQQQRPSKLSSALKGINGGVFAGYGKQWNRFYLGLEATYLLSNEKATLDSLTFRKKNTAEIAIRPGFVVGHALFYGKIGFL